MQPVQWLLVPERRQIRNVRMLIWGVNGEFSAVLPLLCCYGAHVVRMRSLSLKVPRSWSSA